MKYGACARIRVAIIFYDYFFPLPSAIRAYKYYVSYESVTW